MYVMQTGEKNAKKEICSDQVSELVSDMSQTRSAVSKTCILKVSLGRDAFALSGGSGNCHLQK